MKRVESTSISVQRIGLAKDIAWTALALFVVPLMVIAALAFMTYLAAGAEPLLVWAENLIYVVYASPCVAALALVLRFAKRSAPGALDVSDEGLVVRRGKRATTVPFGRLVEGWVSPLRSEVTLRLARGDVVCASVDSQQQAQALLEALGLSAARRTMQMRLGETAFLDIVTWLLAPPTLLPLAVGLADAVGDRLDIAWLAWLGVPLGGALIALTFYAVRALWGPADIVVGADGIKVKQGLGERFLPHAKFLSADARPRAVTLFLEGGEEVRARARHLTDFEGAQLAARINDALAVWKAGGTEAANLARLDRNERTPAAWRDALGALLARDEGYRDARVTRDQLLGVLEDASAGVERRVAAAIALRASEPELQLKIRVAAAACANKRVRIALEKVAEGDVEHAAIEEAIAADGRTQRRAPERVAPEG